MLPLNANGDQSKPPKLRKCMFFSVAATLVNVTRDQTVYEDSNMQLLCEATGEPSPNITWAQVLQDNSKSELLHLGPTWDFPNISRTASGTYRCTADNGFGNPVSHKVKVNIICKWIYLVPLIKSPQGQIYGGEGLGD